MTTLESLPVTPIQCSGPDAARNQWPARPHEKDMTMETLAILGIALIIGLITLGVMVFAYKASPTQSEKG